MKPCGTRASARTDSLPYSQYDAASGRRTGHGPPAYHRSWPAGLPPTRMKTLRPSHGSAWLPAEYRNIFSESGRSPGGTVCGASPETQQWVLWQRSLLNMETTTRSHDTQLSRNRLLPATILHPAGAAISRADLLLAGATIGRNHAGKPSARARTGNGSGREKTEATGSLGTTRRFQSGREVESVTG